MQALKILILLAILFLLIGIVFARYKHVGQFFEGVLYSYPENEGRFISFAFGGNNYIVSNNVQFGIGDYLIIDKRTCKYPNNNTKLCLYPAIEVDTNRSNHFLKKFSGVRTYIIDQSRKSIPYSGLGIFLAMSIGDTENLPEETYDQLKDIGAVHLLVVSGYNISLLLNSLHFIFARLGRVLYVLFCVFGVIAFVAIAGFDPPVVRAAIMGMITIIAKASGNGYWSLYILGLSVLVLLSINPLYLHSVSFQLSVAATFGVIVSGIFSFKSGFLEMLFTSVFANLFVIPIISYHFGVINYLGIATTPMLSWLVPLIIYLGILLVLTSIYYVEILFISVIDCFWIIVDFANRFIELSVEYKFSFFEISIYYLCILGFIWFKVSWNYGND